MLAGDSAGRLIRFGRDLIANTAEFLGPRGRIAHLSNGMNCQNCHLDAGSRLYGNCLGAAAANYPGKKPRPRSGRIESLEFRINDCMVRSMNGRPLDSLSHEMRAMVAYLKWLGKDVPKGTRPAGTGIRDIPFLDRAADPANGARLFVENCQRCHQADGQGQPDSGGHSYKYPPLWGPGSYNTGAGLNRISRVAAFIKDNMPFDKASHSNPVLSDDAAWDLAAYIVSMPRPRKTFAGDWPRLSDKPVDYPYGPFPDTFSVHQHSFGPFQPIAKARAQKSHP
jgi:thiosulfate dehydrogenase